MNSQLSLVLLWHMHQPDYRNYETNEFVLPWVYLHAIKDYTDMAFHLERHPKVKAIINFVPILLDQLEDYAEQFSHAKIRDPLLRLLATPDLNQITQQDRIYIINSCFLSNHEKMLQPYPAYKRLFELYDTQSEKGKINLTYFSGQYLADLLVWYHLAWMGESVRRNNEIIIKQMTQSEEFSYADRMQLFNLIGDLIKEIIPRYRKLAESGQIELSTTPHYHPLSPLLIDFASARDSIPDVTLPQNNFYPDGSARVNYHLASAQNSHAHRFGEKPVGIWPAEGAISTPLLEIFSGEHCQWCASGENVLANSLHKSYPGEPLQNRSRYLYRPYKVVGENNSITCFFRDDKLSDMIGFEYSKWFGRDAAEDLLQSLEQIQQNAFDNESPIVSIILDGENAWETYPYNGFYFLDDLYSLLETHPIINTTTYREYIETPMYTDNVTTLPELSAGSWVYGTLSTWIGDHEKNLAWDMLCTAKHDYDQVMQSGQLSEEEKDEASKQLASCESSDWFWWFGDYNPAHSVESFDHLYRLNLINLYQLLKSPVPDALLNPISKGAQHIETSGAMRRSS